MGYKRGGGEEMDEDRKVYIITGHSWPKTYSRVTYILSSLSYAHTCTHTNVFGP